MSKSRIGILLTIFAISLFTTPAFASVDLPKDCVYTLGCSVNGTSIDPCPLLCNESFGTTTCSQTSESSAENLGVGNAEDETSTLSTPRGFLNMQNVRAKENTMDPSVFSGEAPSWTRVEAKLCLPIGAYCWGLGNSYCCSGKCEVVGSVPEAAFCVAK